MSRWLIPVALIGLLTLACGAFGWFQIDRTLVLQRTYEQQARQQADDYRDRAAKEITQRCYPLAPRERDTCIYVAKQASRDQEREEYDLEAQRITAAWTAAMGGAAIIGMVVGIIGVALIFQTFREARRSNLIAMSDRRASLYANTVTFAEEGETIKVQVEVKNFGQSEASDVEISTAIAFGPFPLPDNPPPLALKIGPEGKMQPGQSRYTYTERHDLAEWKPKVENETAALLVYGHIAYTDQFERSHSDRFYYFCTGKDFALRTMRVCGPWKEKEEQEGGDNAEPELDLKGGGKALA